MNRIKHWGSRMAPVIHSAPARFSAGLLALGASAAASAQTASDPAQAVIAGLSGAADNTKAVEIAIVSVLVILVAFALLRKSMSK